LNKIYSKVWNKSLGMLVVASELAHANGKGTTTKRLRAAAATLAVGMMMAASSAYAAAGVTPCDSLYPAGHQPTATGTDALSCGYEAAAGGAYGLALGYLAKANNYAAVVLGANAASNGDYSTVVGSGEPTFINPDGSNRGNFAGMYGSAFGWAAQSNNRGTTALGAYAHAGNALLGAGAETYDAAVGYKAGAIGGYSTAIGPFTHADGLLSLAAGGSASANAQSTVALGAYSQATGVNSVALGQGSVADADNTVSVGSAATQRRIVNVSAGKVGTDAVNVDQLDDATRYFMANSTGTDAQALGSDSVAIGPAAKATGTSAIAVGNGTVADQWDIAMGEGAQALSNTGGNGAGSIAFGYKAFAQGDGSDAAGNNAAALAIGAEANATADGSIALGEKAQATQYYATTVGQYAGATARNATALGGHSSATQEGSVALGANTVADRAGMNGAAEAFSNAAVASVQGAVSVGATGNERQITNVAGGTQDTDAVNVRQLTAVDDMVTQNTAGIAANTNNIATNTAAIANINNGGGIKYFHTSSTKPDSSATGMDTVAIGSASAASGTNSIAAGTRAQATSYNAIAIGTDASADGRGGVGSLAIGGGDTSVPGRENVAGKASIAVGFGSQANPQGGGDNMGGSAVGVYAQANNGSYNTANGYKALANAPGGFPDNAGMALASGAFSTASGTGSSAVGAGAKATATTASAFGAGSSATATNAVALGAGSVADVANTVSVGTVGGERKITNVAAGVVSATSTDAVNGTQLNSTNQAVAQNTTNIATNTASIGTINNTAVFYTDATRKAVVLGNGTKPVKVGNVAAGAVTASSTDAVNGTQLNSTNQAIAQLGGATAKAAHLFDADGATDNSEDALALGKHAVAGGASSFAVGDESAVYGYGASAYGKNTVALGAGSQANVDNTSAVGSLSSAMGKSSTAVGYSSTATADNSVALGANSQADRANSVSVGTVGGERQVTNVAAGTVSASSTDAVNGNQLNSTNQAVAQNTTNIATNTASIGTINTTAMFYTDATRKAVVLGNGTTPVKVGNVAAGTAGTDAVNVAQLKAQADTTAKATHLFDADGATDGSEDALAIGGHSVAGGASSFAIGDESAAYGFGASANGKNTVALGAGSFAAVDSASAVGSLASAVGANSTAVGYSSTAIADNSVALGANSQADRANSVSMGTVGGERQVTNVAAGTQSTDAVNKGQLDTTNAAVVQNTTAIGTINNTAVFYTDTTRTAVTLGNGTTPVKMGNVAAGAVTATSTDAVNGGQLYTTNQAVAQLGGATAKASHLFDADGATDGSEDALAIGEHSVAGGASSFAIGDESAAYGFGASANGKNTVALGAGSFAAVDNASAVGSLASAMGQSSTAVGYSSTANADNSVALGANSQADRVNSVSVGSTTLKRQITNVAAGIVSADSTDAVNGTQLNSTNQAVAENTASIGAINSMAVFYTDAARTALMLGNGMTSVRVSNVAAGTADTDAVNVAQLKAQADATAKAMHLFDADGATDGSEDALAIGEHSVAGGANSFAIGDESASYGAGAKANGNNSVALGAGSLADVDYASAIGSLATAAGANSTAVGYSSTATANNSVALGANSQADRVNSVSVGTVGGERQITNVAAGTVSASSTDAVNGSQLQITNDAVAQNTTNIATNTASIGAINSTAVFYTDASHTAVILGDGNAPVTLGNVADGSAIHDAVNKGQLDAAVANIAGGLGDLADSAVKYDDSDDEQVTLAGANGTRISNLQASNVLSDAATVGQINDVLSVFGGGAMLQAGGGISMPSFAIQGGTYNNVGDALGALDTALAGAWSGISDIDNRVSVLEQNYASGGTTNTHVATDGPGDGSDSASVVPGSTGVAVGSHATAGGDHGTAVGGDSYAAGPNDTAIGGNAKVNADGSTAVGANTAIAASATNAVAVGEGSSVTEASGTALGQGSSVTAVGAVALGQGSVADRANTVSVGTASNQRQITNVAAGVQATDAANVGQVQEALVTAKTYADAGDQQTLQKANAYTDQKVGSFATTSDINALRDEVNGQFHAVDKRMNQVGAMGTAMAQMSFSTQGVNTPNRVGVGVGGYHGEAALSVGYSRQLSPKANLTFGAAVSGNEASGGVGVGFGW